MRMRSWGCQPPTGVPSVAAPFSSEPGPFASPAESSGVPSSVAESASSAVAAAACSGRADSGLTQVR